MDPKRVVAEGYDQLGPAFSAWVAENPKEVRSWFLGEVLARLGEGSHVLELGCGPGTAAMNLSAGRRYVGVDLSRVQLSIAQRRVPHVRFIRADFTTMIFRPASFDGVVAFYVFNHVPREELAPTFARILDWLRPGGRLMLSLGTSDNAGAIEGTSSAARCSSQGSRPRRTSVCYAKRGSTSRSPRCARRSRRATAPRGSTG